MIGKCKVCNKIFHYYPSNQIGKYCSLKCCVSSSEWREKQSRAKIGKKHTKEVKEKMSLSHKGIKQSDEWIKKRMASFKKMIDKRGRRSTEYSLIKASEKYRDWRKRVFERDNFTCQKCGDNVGGNLEPHHRIPFSFLVEENKLLNTNNLFDIENGITLCHKCHKKTMSYGQKLQFQIEHRLMKQLRECWEYDGSKGGFDVFYKEQIEYFISKYKEKLN